MSAFILRFLLLLALAPLPELALAAWAPQLLAPWLETLAWLAAPLAGLAGASVQVNGATMILPGGATVVVIANCSGLTLMLLLGAALLAYPASARARWRGWLLGAALLQGLNLLRLASLAWLMQFRPEALHFWHRGVFETGLVLAALACFLVWLWRQPAGDDAPAAA